MNVTLFTIKQKGDGAKKILTICQKALEKKIFLKIFCSNPESIRFLDQLLWQFPEQSFLPHATDTNYTCEPILLSLNKEIKKPFTHIIWLLKEPPPNELKWTHLYDFDDQSSPDSIQLSNNRYQFYKQMGCKISLLN